MPFADSSCVQLKGEWLFYLDDQLIKHEKNLIVQSGLNYLAALLIAEQTNDMTIHLAMGTGTNAPSAGDTALQTEGFRKALAAKTRSGNMVRLRAFMLASEANADWNEFGIFLASTDSAGSGTLLNRLATPITKASNQVLTIEVRITFNAG